MTESIFQTVVTPVASPEDAETTCEAFLEHVGDDAGRVVFVYVIEKAGGAPDKASVEQREEYADEIEEVVDDYLDDAGLAHEMEVRYGTDVVEAIRTTAADLDASSIVFTPRSTSRWVRLITGDTAYSLITESDVPVVSLPELGGDG